MGQQQHRPFTEDQDKFIRITCERGWTMAEVARRLGRAPNCIRTRAMRLGLKFQDKRNLRGNDEAV